MRCVLNQPRKNAMRIFIEGAVLTLCLLLAGMATETNSYAADFTNQILAVTPISEKGSTGVEIVAEKEIGSRYTSYLLSKPPRVVFDFQGADVATLPAVSQLSDHPVREIRVSLYESAAVKSGRVELILTERVPYTVQIVGNSLLVKFTPVDNPPTTLAEVTEIAALAPTSVPVAAPVVASVVAEPPDVARALAEVKPLVVMEIVGRTGEVLLRADGTLDRCKTFALKEPARFVVDCFDINENIPDKSVRLAGPIKLVRVGNYPDKIRFVLEGDPQTIASLVSFPVSDGLALRYKVNTSTFADAKY